MDNARGLLRLRGGSTWGLIVAALLGGLAWCPGVALGQVGVRARMRWSAPADCPGASAVQAAVNEILGRDAFGEEEPDFEVRARISATDDPASPLRASLQLVSMAAGVVGERTLSLPSGRCEDALPPLSLVLSLMLDHSRREIELLIPRPAAAPERPLEVRGLLALGIGAHHNLVPATMVLFDARAGVEIDAWSVEAWMEITPEASAEAASGGGGVAAWAGLGGVSVCGSPIRVTPLALGLCAEIGAGWIASRGFGLAETRTSLRPQVALAIAVRLRVALTDALGLRFEAGARALAFRDRLLLAPAGVPELVFEPWPVVPYGRFSLDLRL